MLNAAGSPFPVPTEVHIASPVGLSPAEAVDLILTRATARGSTVHPELSTERGDAAQFLPLPFRSLSQSGAHNLTHFTYTVLMFGISLFSGLLTWAVQLDASMSNSCRATLVFAVLESQDRCDKSIQAELMQLLAAPGYRKATPAAKTQVGVAGSGSCNAA